MHTDTPLPDWDAIDDHLLDLAADDLRAGREARPMLAAFDGARPVALVGLRSFDPGEALQALLEVLALVLPLGADRLAFAAPGRAWSLDDPIPPVCGDGDLRQRVILLALADGHGAPCQLTTVVRPFAVEDGTPHWGEALRSEEPPDSPVASAMTVLVDARHRFDDLGDERKLAAQFARVLLLGHEVVLAGTAADRLMLASTR